MLNARIIPGKHRLLRSFTERDDKRFPSVGDFPGLELLPGSQRTIFHNYVYVSIDVSYYSWTGFYFKK